MTPGDVREIEYRSTSGPDGTVRVEYRGRSTVDVERESDGAKLDELDVSGPGSEVFAESDGTFRISVSLDGPSIILPREDADAAAFGRAGLPYFVFYEAGTLAFTVVQEAGETSDEPPTTASVTVEGNTTTGVRDVCHLLDAASTPPPRRRRPRCAQRRRAGARRLCVGRSSPARSRTCRG